MRNVLILLIRSGGFIKRTLAGLYLFVERVSDLDALYTESFRKCIDSVEDGGGSDLEALYKASISKYIDSGVSDLESL